MNNHVFPKSVVNLQSAASTDETRPMINGVQFERNLAVATSGHVLVATPFESNGFSGKQLRFSTKKLKQKPTQVELMEVSETKLVSNAQHVLSQDGVSAEVLNTDQVPFPNWRMVIPKKSDDERSIRINFNAKLLRQALDAMALDTTGAANRHESVTLEIVVPKEPEDGYESLSPIVIGSYQSQSVGIIMPMRNDDDTSPLDTITKLAGKSDD